MRDRAERALSPGHVHASDLDPRRVDRRRAAVEPFHHPVVELTQDVGLVAGDEVDESGRGVQRFLVGEGAALRDRLFGEHDVAAARVGE